MNITPEEAQMALNDIQHATKRARSVFNIWAYHMLIWGCVWTIGFLVSQFRPQWINCYMDSNGSYVALRFDCHWYDTGKTRTRWFRDHGGLHQFAHWAFSMGCFTVLSFSGLLYFPLTAPQVAILWITVMMFGYIMRRYMASAKPYRLCLV